MQTKRGLDIEHGKKFECVVLGDELLFAKRFYSYLLFLGPC